MGGGASGSTFIQFGQISPGTSSSLLQPKEKWGPGSQQEVDLWPHGLGVNGVIMTATFMATTSAYSGML